ncbi:MAG: SDR family oxidoreductase [Eubacteriaceae bacterium]|nr:SDR family oxidoreductase [Eubacteriaceae bacterium]
MGRLEGKAVLLTGASSGIGKQTAIRFAQEGARLTICARRKELLDETAKLCADEGAEVFAYPCDLNNYDDLVKMVDGTIERYGKIDVLVNNAVKGDTPHPLIDYTTEDLRQSIETNYIAPWNLMRLCYPHMKEIGGGSIVNICSTAGTMGLEGFACYASTKEALRGLSRVAANEWGRDGIRVNVLNPSAITDSLQIMHQESPEIAQPIFDMMASIAALKRVGDAYEDIAPAILFLASDDSRYMTGQTLNVEGGGFIVP